MHAATQVVWAAPTLVVLWPFALKSPGTKQQVPARHWQFTDEGITNEIVETRRASAYFVPIPAPKKNDKQLHFDTE